MRNVLQSIRRAIREEFSPYIVWDCHGTKQYAWSMQDAIGWLPACGDNAAIINRRTRQIEVSRHQTRAY